MNESILTSIKKMLGITEEYEQFDLDIKIHINTVFMILNQLGIGKDNFYITDSSFTWSDFISENYNLESVKTYVYLKVKLLFDPPASSAAVESIKEQVAELEWRISVAREEVKSQNE